MRNISDIADQLFHTYSTETSSAITDNEHVSQLLDGLLTLAPHSSQRIGPDFHWGSDPLEDANWRFQFHCLVWLDRLRESSLKAESVEGIELYERLLQSWVADNPVDSPPSDYSWFDMAVGVRAIVLLKAVGHFGAEQWLIDAIRTHGEHLSDPDNYEGRGNHSLHQDMGLIAIGEFMERADWIELSVDRILAMLSTAVDDEGVSVEGSVDYQYRNYRWYEEAARRIKSATGELPEVIGKALENMPIFMAHATSPSGRYALLGDTLEHRAPILPGTNTEWVRDAAFAPKPLTKLYKGGYLFARSRWATWKEDPSVAYFTLRFGAGRSSAVHGHEDGGSITWDMHGEKLLCDSGLYAYEGGPYRLFFRGRESHNVVDVLGRKYYPSAENPLICFQETRTHVLATIQVKAIEGVEWHRTVLFSLEHGYILVDDRVRDTLMPAPILQRWQLPRQSVMTVNSNEGIVDVSTPMNNLLRFSSIGGRNSVRIAEGSEAPISGWRSEDYRMKFPTPELSFVAQGDSVRFSTLIEVHDRPDREGFISIADSKRTSKSLVVSLGGNNWQERVELTSSGFNVTT
ncbi:heparinase II/III domain-containing protein [Arthrobacter koreensis]|uniref:heparinase II/III domain-containing protein n=1 Tax=Arthrobacter koreensis TaxID=199136 RepID=UPI002DBD5196|nr:heparinase II/III family protein [Arthrobacter koreensis]MEB7505061.1 heparinase II/III family protein [Arthrobacter koreensis]